LQGALKTAQTFQWNVEGAAHANRAPELGDQFQKKKEKKRISTPYKNGATGRSHISNSAAENSIRATFFEKRGGEAGKPRGARKRNIRYGPPSPLCGSVLKTFCYEPTRPGGEGRGRIKDKQEKGA